jgi:mono/diheme cytochrome c family protein/glucose/arabinose dehydrogenase
VGAPWLKRIAIGLPLALLMLIGAGWLALRWWSGPGPEVILAEIERPPSPPLEPEAALGAFLTAPGFRVELVASEPLVVDPVAMDWDEAGRLYVVEMRGYMPDIDGRGEDRPVGRVVVLEDVDHDGRMDTSRVFLDGLVMPRAIAVLPEGVLIGEPPHLWRCRDIHGEGTCGERMRIGDYALGGTNVEHSENGLLPGLDGWLYNAKSDRRLRLQGDAMIEAPTSFRGQWGIAQDDEGLLYHNHNSGFLYVDRFPGEYLLRQEMAAARRDRPGLNEALAEGEQVWGIRVAPGLNRAYARGTLRRDGRQAGPTGVSGLVIQRGDQFGPEFVGDAFVPESAGAAVAHFALDEAGGRLQAEHRLYPDPDWSKREFLASTDERFRPVDVKVGPDGALWVIDMYRGVIQHAEYVSDHLRDYVAEHGLAEPGATGRIWRVVRADHPIARRPPSLDSQAERLAALDHPNGWVRDRAARAWAAEATPEAVTALSEAVFKTAPGRMQALWTLHGLGALDEAAFLRGLADEDARVRRTALRAGEARCVSVARGSGAGADCAPHVLAALRDPDHWTRVQAILTLGAWPRSTQLLERLLPIALSGDEVEQQAVLSGLAGLEVDALEASLSRVLPGYEGDERAEAWLALIAGAAYRQAMSSSSPALAGARLFDRLGGLPSGLATTLLEGMVASQRFGRVVRLELEAPHVLFEKQPDDPAELQAAISALRPHVTWPGDPRPGGARALSIAEEARRQRGAELYAERCATCHATDGRGAGELAPPLVGSPRVRDSDDWLVRVVLHGLSGPVTRDGRTWDGEMPGHGGDESLDDASLAALFTHLRRAWGHGDEPVTPETVASIRSAEANRSAPWTLAELEVLPIRHRLDRYVGTYQIQFFPVRLVVERRGGQLFVGRGDGAAGALDERGLGVFEGEGLRMTFEVPDDGPIQAGEVAYESNVFRVDRAD